MGRLDLDLERSKRSAARSEANAETHELVFGGKSFVLPPELPYQFADALARREAKEALEALLGAGFSEFWKLLPSVDDINALAEGIVGLYGITVGEASPSADSSSNGSSPSRQTSFATTG